MDRLVTNSESDSLRGLLLVFAVVALVIAIRTTTTGVFSDTSDTEPIDATAPPHFVSE